MFKKILSWFRKQYKNTYYCSRCDVKLERINSFLDAAISLKYKYKCPNCGMEKSIRAR
jgi:transcription elongation factor Elf1